MAKNSQHCSVCIRECETGHSFCQRRDENGYLKQENRFNAILVDSLFDKPVTHYMENAKVLSVGSWGCNFRCLGCQNVNLSWSVTGQNLGYMDINPAEIVSMALKNECMGICYTYNEPAILLETVEKIAAEAHEKGIFNVFVTNSTLTEKSVKRISGNIDAVAADIKSMDDDFYYDYCGAEGIPDVAEKILLCIRSFYNAGCHVEVRTNIIPGLNESEETYRGIASWIRDNLSYNTPWHITRFFPANKLNHISQTEAESMLKAQKIGFDEGLKFVHVYLDKGCDCAKKSCLVNQEDVPETGSGHCCCSN
jgi:pyruvate formate lyase activating enzyme